MHLSFCRPIYSPSSYRAPWALNLFQVPDFFSFSNQPVCISSPLLRYHFHSPVIFPLRYLPRAFNNPLRRQYFHLPVFAPLLVLRAHDSFPRLKYSLCKPLFSGARASRLLFSVFMDLDGAFPPLVVGIRFRRQLARGIHNSTSPIPFCGSNPSPYRSIMYGMSGVPTLGACPDVGSHLFQMASMVSRILEICSW